MSVYILHLDSPLAHAKHYTGWSDHVESRLDHHKNGTGARFTQVCNERGITYQLALVIDGDRTLERKLKNTKNVADYCPLCHEKPRIYHPKNIEVKLCEV
jgi:predicted GIY-YIG superfamily endonuclease